MSIKEYASNELDDGSYAHYEQLLIMRELLDKHYNGSIDSIAAELDRGESHE